MSRHGRRISQLVLLALLMFAVVLMHHIAGPIQSSGAATSGSETTAVSGTAMPDAHVMDHGQATLAADGPGTPHGTAAGDGASGPGPSEHNATHRLLHLCLAVLTAAVLTIGLWLLAFRGLPVLLSRLQDRLRPCTLPRRRPPVHRHGFALLLSLCVIRT